MMSIKSSNYDGPEWNTQHKQLTIYKKTFAKNEGLNDKSGTVLLSPKGVSSPLRSLTSVFGMGTGVPHSLELPRQCFLLRKACLNSLDQINHRQMQNANQRLVLLHVFCSVLAVILTFIFRHHFGNIYLFALNDLHSKLVKI